MPRQCVPRWCSCSVPGAIVVRLQRVATQSRRRAGRARGVQRPPGAASQYKGSRSCTTPHMALKLATRRFSRQGGYPVLIAEVHNRLTRPGRPVWRCRLHLHLKHRRTDTSKALASGSGRVCCNRVCLTPLESRTDRWRRSSSLYSQCNDLAQSNAIPAILANAIFLIFKGVVPIVESRRDEFLQPVLHPTEDNSFMGRRREHSHRVADSSRCYCLWLPP